MDTKKIHDLDLSEKRQGFRKTKNKNLFLSKNFVQRLGLQNSDFICVTVKLA